MPNEFTRSAFAFTAARWSAGFALPSLLDAPRFAIDPTSLLACPAMSVPGNPTHEPMTTQRHSLDGATEVLHRETLLSRTWARPELPGRDGHLKLRQYLPAGIDVHMIALDGWELNCWNGEEYDFHAYDQMIARLLRAAGPKADDQKFIVFCGFRTGVPFSWCERNIDELMCTNKGRRYTAASYASEKFLADCDEVYSTFVQHFEQGPFAEQIIGYNLTNNGNEWFGNQPVGEKWGLEMLDYSRPMRDFFRDFLREQYGEADNLRDAWHDRTVGFDQVEIPSPEQRMFQDQPGFFGDDDGLRQRVADYTWAYNRAHALMACRNARSLKLAMPEPKLVGLMGFYSYCGKWHHSNPQMQGHGDPLTVFDCPDIDYIHAPYHYHHRCFGGPHFSQLAVNSVLLHGKLFVDQLDTKTHVKLGPNTNASTPFETQQVLKRDVSYVLQHNAHCYWMEISPNVFNAIGGASGFDPMHFDDPEITARFRHLRDTLDTVRGGGIRPTAEVALLTSNASHFFRRPEQAYGTTFIDTFRQWVMPGLGTPFDDYVLEDFERIERDYKLYIFTDAAYVPEERRHIIRQRLAEQGATALWFYAPGYVTQRGASLSSCEALTGIKLGYERRRDWLQVELRSSKHPLLHGVEERAYGSDFDPQRYRKDLEWISYPADREFFRFDPLFFADDADATALGELRGTERTGLAVKRMDGWTSVYSAAPLLPASVLRNLAKQAGVHLYSPQGDLVYANQKTVCVQAAASGTRTVRLPSACDVSDLESGAELGQSVDHLELEMVRGEVRMLRLE